jgi:DNA-binding transcriptional LysR family regulator
MAIRSINLNLIPMLQALINEESVVAAARKANLSQPAMSGALSRLRDLLDDPLLVRSGRSMNLTPRAEELRVKVNRLCADIDDLFAPVQFDPATAEKEFVIAAPDYLAFLLGKEFLPRQKAEASGITLRFVDVPNDLPEWLQNSRIDLAVCGNFGVWPTLEYEQLFEDRVVISLSHNHPLHKKKSVTLEQLLEYPYLGFRPSHQRMASGIGSLDLKPQLTVGQFADAVLLSQHGDYVAAAPKSLIDALAELLPLTQVNIADEEPPIDTGVFWVKAYGEAPDMQWLRDTIKECLRGSQK